MFAYKPNFLPSSIILVGAGGTGSRLMPMLGQLVRTCLRQHNPNAWLQRLPIYVVDGDEVEEKNLLRQNFIAKDVGKPKASVLASRYGAAFGIPIFPITEYIPTDLTWSPTILGAPEEFNTFSYNNSVLIMAVDSAEARRTILKQLFHNRYHGVNQNDAFRCFIIDAGNEDAFGQVRFFTPNIEVNCEYESNWLKRASVQTLSEYITDYIPMDVDYYTNLGSSADELSCADLPQTLAVNALAATWIASILQNFLYLKPMIFDGIRFSMNGSVSTEFNTARRWKSRALRQYSGVGFLDRDNCRVTTLSTAGKCIYNLHYGQTVSLYKKAGMQLDSEGVLTPIPKPIPVLVPKPVKVEKTLSATEGTTAGMEVVSEEAVPVIEAMPVPPLRNAEIPPAPPLRPRSRTRPRVVVTVEPFEPMPLPPPAPGTVTLTTTYNPA